MTTSELKKIISQGETSFVQFKERIEDAYKVGTELVAFSNTKGGMLIIGVNDKTGNINGLSFQELQFATNLLANAASENVKPSIVVTTETVGTEDGNVLVVTLKEGMDKPYKDNKGIVWIKNASDKRKVFANSELINLMQNCGMFRPDSCPVPGSSVEDLFDETIKSFLLKRFSSKCKDGGLSIADVEKYSVPQIVDTILPGISLEQLLQNIDLVKPTGELTLAALLLLGKRPQHYKPVFTIKCISFLGNDVADDTFRDKVEDSELEGGLSKQYDVAMAFLKRNLRNIQIEPGFNTLGEMEIPYGALVELVVNALVHRDYAKSSPIRLFVFDDRIELISPGNLPDGLTEEQIREGVSVPRNELLFSNAIFLLPYTGAGSGIRRALKLYPAVQLKNDELRNEFIITIPRRTSEMALGSETEKVRVSENVSKQAKDVSEFSKKVSKRDEKVSVISENVSRTDENVSKLANNVSDCVNFLYLNKIADEANSILNSLMYDAKGKKELLSEIGVTHQTYNIQRFIYSLIDLHLIQPFKNVSLRSHNVKFELTEKGRLVLNVLNNKKK